METTSHGLEKYLDHVMAEDQQDLVRVWSALVRRSEHFPHYWIGGQVTAALVVAMACAAMGTERALQAILVERLGPLSYFLPFLAAAAFSLAAAYVTRNGYLGEVRPILASHPSLRWYLDDLKSHVPHMRGIIDAV